MFNWLKRRPWHYVKSLRYVYVETCMLWGNYSRDVAVYAHLWQRSDGRRKVITEHKEVRDRPEIVAWLAGGPLP